jgi:hypothetical protein
MDARCGARGKTNARETTGGFNVRKDKMENGMCAEGDVCRDMSVERWLAMPKREMPEEQIGKEGIYRDSEMSICSIPLAFGLRLRYA